VKNIPVDAALNASADLCGAYWPGATSVAAIHNDLMVTGAPRAVAGLPRAPGVYRFRDDRGGVLYIGRATTLRNRVASYWSDLRGRDHLAPMVAQVARIEAVCCDSPHEAAWLERNLLEVSLPPWNRTPGGQESLVYIRMDKGPSAPGLTVEHLRRPAGNVQYFGPYLGGLRARQAVAALHRILPLSCTGSRLRGAQLDLARARNVASTDRTELIATLTAVLRRQPRALAWARAELEQLRNRAAGTLAFEFAGRIHSELAALDWVTCPQRVTTMDTGDFDVYGYSGGVLVRFGIRGGRLCRWSQRSCGQARAAPQLAATPAGWTGFARRNAELAAAIEERST
jgi:excinuclease ABC subunit C